MKKFFTLILALTAVMAINAKKVVFDFSNPAAFGITAPAEGAGTNITAPIVYEGVTMTGTKGTTDFRFYNGKVGDNYVITLRVYKGGGTLKFEAEEDINCIELEGTKIAFSELTGKTWTGAAKSVTFTCTDNSTLSKATVYIGETPEVWVPDTINVAKARELIDKEDSKDHYIQGIVAGQPFNLFDSFKDGKVTFWMVDELAGDSLEAYQVLGKDKAKWASMDAACEELRIGDTVLVYATSLAKYGNTYEIASGNYVEKLGANPNPPAILGPDTITVAKAVELANELAEGKSTTNEFVVAGYAVTVYDQNSDGTWSFYMSDDEGAKGDFQGSYIKTDEAVVVNDFMLVRGKLQKYKSKAGNIILRINNGTGVHGDAPIVELDTIGAVAAYDRAKALAVDAKEKVAVLAYVASVDKEYNSEYGNITVWLNDDPTSTYGNIKAYRAKVDAEYGPKVAAGDKVLVVGYLEHTQDGGKDYYDIAEGSKMTLVQSAQGIENIVLTEKAQKVVVDGVIYIVRDNKMFNLQGVQVR